jgi:hypothetical protein
VTGTARLLAFLATSALLIACGTHDAATSSPPALTEPPAPSPTLDAEPATAAELDAQRFRGDFGLRSDLAWIRVVAADPGSDRTTYGVPLTADEIAELSRRSSALEAIRGPVLDYATAQPDYAGAWIDNDRGGILVVQFAGPVLKHQAALFAMVRPGAPLEVREVRWSQSQLEALQGQIEAGRDWFLTIPASLYGDGTNVVTDRFEVQVSSADPDVEAKVLAHFGWSSDMVVVKSDGTGALLLQPGTVEVLAEDPAGRPIEGLACITISDIPGAHDSRSLPIPTTDEDGICQIVAAAGDYTIQLERGQAPPTVVGQGRATITARQLTHVTIKVG